jgi:hypothetical protein
MHNDNRTVVAVSHDRLEAILKLAHSGSTPEAISFALDLNDQTVIQIIANDPMHRARMVQSIKEKSRKYRCTHSNRLMISPVMARDANFYEQSILEADSSLSLDPFIFYPKLKAKIADFCKESLKVLEGYLRQKHPQEDVLELIAECLSVLCPEAGLQIALRVLGLVEGKTVRRLTGKLWSLVPEEMLFGLIDQLARELPYHALFLAALIILEPRSERAYEEAFRCFAELLSQAALGSEAIDLAEEVSERLSSTQLSQMNAALGACPREGGDRLDGLRLKEAYALLREGEVEAATSIVNALRMNSSLEKEVMRFNVEVGLSSGKMPILKQRLSAKLEEISRESPFLAETLGILHQLFNEELYLLKSKATSQNLLKAEALNETLAKLGQQTSQDLINQDERIKRNEEQAKRKEAECQDTLSSLRTMVQAQIEDLVKAGQTASHIQATQDAQIQRLEEQAQRKEGECQDTLSSLRAMASTENLEKAFQTASQKQFALEKMIRSIEGKSQMSEAAARKALSSLKGEVGVLRKDLAQVESQCNRLQAEQETILQGFAAQSQKAEAAAQQALNSLREEVVVLSKDLAQVANQCTRRAQSAQEEAVKMVEQSYQKTKSAAQKALSSLRDKVEALTGVHLKAGEEMALVKRAQDRQIQGLDGLRGEVVVLSKDLAQVAQSAKEEAVKMVKQSYQKTKTAAQKALSSLRDKVEALTGEHLKAGDEIKSVKRAQYAQIQGIDEKFHKAEDATQEAFNILLGDVENLRIDLEQAWSQCKQAQLAQEAMLQSLEAQPEVNEANALNRDLAETSLDDTREALYHLHEVPTFIYSYKRNTDQLHQTNLVTGEHSSHQVPSYAFTLGCCWSEVPGGSLLITGGELTTVVREVVRIDVGTFEVSPQPPMLTPRRSHAAVYHTPCLYILGGLKSSFTSLNECERYVLAEN